MTTSDEIKNKLLVTQPEIDTLMNKHFRNMGFMNNVNEWKEPLFETIQSNITLFNLKQMVDKISNNCNENPYLVRALESFKTLEINIPDQAMIEYVTFTMAMESATQAMLNSPPLTRLIVAIWDKLAKNPLNVVSKIGLEASIKYYSVRIPLLEFLNGREVNDDFFSEVLSINIIEATIFDFIKGNNGNAFAGYILSQNKSSKFENQKTGSGPTERSKDGERLRLRNPFPKQWDDLYSTWNLGFVSQFNTPLWYIPLLIPSVSGYANNPEEYIYNRILALFAILNFKLIMEDSDDKIMFEEYLPGDFITKSFDTTNRKSAEEYASLILNADKRL